MKRLILCICIAAFMLRMVSIPCDAASDIQTNKKVIALTFDDGPHPRQTKQIMDVLDRYGIKATFFVIGINVKNYPGIISEVLNRGHEIGNHTYSHTHASRLNMQELERQITDCEREVQEQTGKTITLFRPPEGAMSEQMRAVVKERGYINVLWTLDTRDWAHTPPQTISDHIIQNAKNGDIILMHDYIGANSPTVQALELFIPKLIEQGFTFVTVGQLLELK